MVSCALKVIRNIVAPPKIDYMIPTIVVGVELLQYVKVLVILMKLELIPVLLEMDLHVGQDQK